MRLPVKPMLESAAILREARPYKGLIEPGSIFAWEPDLPHARCFCLVTKVVKREGDETLIYTRDIKGSGEYYNEESRFREAVYPTLFNPWPV